MTPEGLFFRSLVRITAVSEATEDRGRAVQGAFSEVMRLPTRLQAGRERKSSRKHRECNACRTRGKARGPRSHSGMLPSHRDPPGSACDTLSMLETTQSAFSNPIHVNSKRIRPESGVPTTVFVCFTR